MGLDAVEIVMEVEEAFGVSLEDAEVEKIYTPRELIDAVIGKVAHADGSGCLTQRAFHLVRRSLMNLLGLKRAQITPAVRLADLAPKPARSDLLAQLAADLRTGPLPALQRRDRLLRLLAVVSIGLGVLAGIALHGSALAASSGVAWCLGLAVAACAQTCAWFATAPLCLEFPPIIATAGDLASSVPGGWTREQVAARVREIVIEQLGCEKTYREDASFIKDPGLS
jgi:acyl carrier protein